MSKGLFDDGIIEVPCPKCSKKHKKTIGWLRSHREIACSCGVGIVLDHAQFKRDLKGVDDAWGRVKDTLSKFNKI